MLACALRPAPSHQGSWNARPACCSRALVAAPPRRNFPRQPSQDASRRRLFVPSSPQQAKAPAPQGTFVYSRALRLVARGAAGEPPASLLAGVLAPELCSPEALEELMAEAGPGGQLLLCRLHAYRRSWPNGSQNPPHVAAVLELVGSLDGKPAPEWEGGAELVQEVQGWEWEQPLVPVLWSAERGTIRPLPGAAGKPSGDAAFKPSAVQLTDHELLKFSWSIYSELEWAHLLETNVRRLNEILSEIGIYGTWNGGMLDEVYKELPVPRKMWNKVVVEDEGVPVLLWVPVDRHGTASYERVLLLEAPVTLRQLLEILYEFYNRPVVGLELEAFRRFAPDIAVYYDEDNELCWSEVRSPDIYFNSIWHVGPGKYSIVLD